MNKKAAFFIYLSVSFFAVSNEAAPATTEASVDSKKLMELNDSEIRQLLGKIKRVKSPVDEVDPVVEVGEYIELQSASDLMNVDPQTHLVIDSVSRCQLRVDFEAFKALAKTQNRDTSDGLILSQFYKENTTIKRLIKISGPAVASWENAQAQDPALANGPIPPARLIMTYPLDDSRGILKELVCNYSADEKDIGTFQGLKEIAKNTKDSISQVDLMSTLRTPDRLRFLTPKASRASDPVIGDGEKAKDSADRYKGHI